MALGAGTRISHYEIQAHLGSGGMGEVYRARDLTLQRDVALKLLPADLQSDVERLRRFEQEARAASALNHPAIVAIYELGRATEQSGRPYISMELVEGRTLRQVLTHGPLPPRQALQIASQIAGALAKAHAAGVVHRDLKPDNLMVSSDGQLKILDFGLARLIGTQIGETSEATTIDRPTRPGVLLGTVGYMSPEQASGADADYRSDQFAFGLVLYELLTGRRPFQRATTVETLSAIIRDDPPPIDLPTGVPLPARWIVERCLSKAPDDRYASTKDLAHDLATLRDHVGDRTGAAPAPAPAAGRETVGWREIVAWGAVLLLGATLVAVITRDRNAPLDTPISLTVEPPAGSTFHLSVGAPPFALSPDGRSLAFVASGQGPRRIWLRSFDSLENRPLAGTEGASGPFWSPDGSAIGFFVGGHLKRVPIAGGDAVTLCEARGGGGAAWSRDGVILFATSVDAGLSTVPAAGGPVSAVTSLDQTHSDALQLSPAFLSDGRHYVFVAGGPQAGVGGLYLGALGTTDRTLLRPSAIWVTVGESDRLFFVDIGDRKLLMQQVDPAGRRLVGDPVLVAERIAMAGPTAAIAASASGDIAYWTGGQDVTQLTWMRRDGTTVATVGPPGYYMNMMLSPDGRQAAVDRFDTDPSIWLIDVGRGSISRATFSRLYESTPIWAPDGRSFVFASARDSPPNLYVKRLDAQGDDRRLFSSPIQSFPQSWSRDGLVAFVTIDPKTQADIWLVPGSGDRAPWPIIQTDSIEMHPRISPDGRWLAYTSTETGAQAVYVTRFPKPAGKWAVSVGGGGWPVWRPDSRELYYRASDGTLMTVSIGAGTEFEAGVPVKLFAPKANPGPLGAGTFYDVAADGRFLVNIFVERRTPPATVVLNWAPPAARGQK